MARYLRIHAPQTVHHFTARFVNRAYRMTDEARAEYLVRLGHALERTDWVLLAYALMSNHVHLCALAQGDPAQRLIQPVHGGFAAWLNRRQGTLGPVFAQRFRSVVWETARLGALLAYIHNNPVRAAVAEGPAHSDWTSHRAYLGQARAPSWLAVGSGLEWSGFAGAAGPARFHEFVCAQMRSPVDARLRGGDLQRARRQVRRALGAPVEISGAVIDGDELRHEVAARAEVLVRARWEGGALEVLRRVAEQRGVELERLRSCERTRAVSAARRLALLVWERLGRPRVEMSAALGLGDGGAAHLVRRDGAARAAMLPVAVALAQACWEGK